MTFQPRVVLKPLGIVLAVVVVVLVIGQSVPHFLTVYNLSNVFVQAALVAVAAYGMTLVLLTGGIDLSVGGLMSLTGVLLAVLTGAGVPWPVAILIALLGGAVIGLLNGLCVAQLGLPPFIATFGTLGICAGLALFISDALDARSIPEPMAAIGNDKVAGIPILVIIALVVLLILELLQRQTTWGVHLRAVGDSPAVARIRGTNAKATLVSAYLGSGILTAAAGTLLASNLSTASPIQGEPYTLSAVAACVIGGVDLFGGRGRLWAAALGTVFLAALKNALNLLGVQPFMQGLVTGLLIILAVFLTVRGPRLRDRVAALFTRYRPGVSA